MSKRKEDQPETNDGEDAAPEPPAKKSRGRPRVNPPKEKDPNVPKRSRGRPKKEDTGDKPAAAKEESAKPPKQGKVVIRKSTSPAKRGRGRPKGSTKKAKGRGRPPKVAKVEEPAPEEEAGEEAEESS